MSKSKGWLIPALIMFALFLAGIGAGYYVTRKPAAHVQAASVQTDTSKLVNITYPLVNGLFSQRVGVKTPESSEALAEAVVREFLKGPGGEQRSVIFEGASSGGVYIGQDAILYIDLSGDFRTSFKGDAMAEFMVLRGLYKTVMENVEGLKGMKILIGGKEAESLGGHVMLDALTPEMLAGGANGS